MNSIRAAIYAQVSSEQQAAAHSIESQLAALRTLEIGGNLRAHPHWDAILRNASRDNCKFSKQKPTKTRSGASQSFMFH